MKIKIINISITSIFIWFIYLKKKKQTKLNKTHYQVQEILINKICSSGVKSTRTLSFIF
jgi:hypothetical protein